MELQKYFAATTFILLSYSAITLACHGTLLASGVQEAEKQSILKEHNRLRQVVATGRYPGQPGAENMREIIWDDELAARAQKWADNCQFRHDPQRTINRFTMGQNLAIIWSTAPLEADDGDFPSRIQSWFNEVQKYSFGDAWSPKTGHYSQLVWGETSLVGCGYSEYKDASKYNKLYVCNYGPGGNVVGYNPYEVGKPSCGTYGMRPSSQYQGLCAAPVQQTSTSSTTSTSVNSISSNTIETYDFQQTKSFNIKQSTFATKILQQASSSSSSSSSSNSQQAKTIIAHTISGAAAATATKTTTTTATSTATSTAISTKSATSTTSTTSAGVSTTGGNSFGSSTRGGSTSHTTETSQYAQYTQYKNKLEAYKPTAVEFQNAVRKHTILRTYLNQPQQQQKPQKTPKEQNQKQEEKTQQQKQEQQVNTPKPATRGWSLLTWRG